MTQCSWLITHGFRATRPRGGRERGRGSEVRTGEAFEGEELERLRAREHHKRIVLRVRACLNRPFRKPILQVKWVFETAYTPIRSFIGTATLVLGVVDFLVLVRVSAGGCHSVHL